MQKLTKRQKEVYDTYATDVPNIVFGCDYNIVMNLVGKGLLSFDHVSGKVSKGDGTIGQTYSYEWVATHHEIETIRETLTVSDPHDRNLKEAGKRKLKEVAERTGYPMISFQTEIHPLKGKPCTSTT